MNLQDFACSMSDLIWGGELGWDRKGGLEALADAIRKKVNTTADAPQEKDGYEECGDCSYLSPASGRSCVRGTGTDYCINTTADATQGKFLDRTKLDGGGKDGRA